jgi:ligand-binding SRPBCC domain-containing protein
LRERVLRREQTLEVGIERAFAFFSRAENLEAITPPWLRFRIASPGTLEMREGTLIRYRLRLHGIPVSWLTRIDEWDPPVGFADRQVRGPYRLWHHTHCFEPLGPDRTRMVDIVRYAHRLGPFGAIAGALVVERDLARIFDYRRDSIGARLLAAGA